MNDQLVKVVMDMIVNLGPYEEVNIKKVEGKVQIKKTSKMMHTFEVTKIKSYNKSSNKDT